MNRTGLLAVAALATAALLVPTGAVTFDPTGTDAVSDDLELRPAEGPNGDYAVINEDDELELLLTDANPSVDGEGVPADAVTPLPNVFTIRNTDSEAATVWVTDDAEDVRFYRGDDPDNAIEGSENGVVIDGGSTVSVGLRIDTRGDHDVADVDTFTVAAEPVESGGGGGGVGGGGGGGGVGGGGGGGGVGGGGGGGGGGGVGGGGGGVGGGGVGGGGGGGGDDTETPTPTTPDDGTETPTQTETPPSDGGTETTETETPPSDGGTETPTPDGVEPPTVGDAPSTPERDATEPGTEDGGGAVEIGGVGLGPLLAIGGGLLVLLAALVGYRRFS